MWVGQVEQFGNQKNDVLKEPSWLEGVVIDTKNTVASLLDISDIYDITRLEEVFFADKIEVSNKDVKDLIEYLNQKKIYITNINLDLFELINNPNLTFPTKNLKLWDGIDKIGRLWSMEDLSNNIKFSFKEWTVYLSWIKYLFWLYKLDLDKLIALLFKDKLFWWLDIELFKKIKSHKRWLEGFFSEGRFNEENKLLIASKIEPIDSIQDMSIYEYSPTINWVKRTLRHWDEITKNQIVKLLVEWRNSTLWVSISWNVLNPRFTTKETTSWRKFDIQNAFRVQTFYGRDINLEIFDWLCLWENEKIEIIEKWDNKWLKIWKKEYLIKDDAEYSFYVSIISWKIIKNDSDDEMSLAQIEYLDNSNTAIITIYSSNWSRVFVPNVDCENLIIDFKDDNNNDDSENQLFKWLEINISKASWKVYFKWDIIDSTLNFSSPDLEVVAQKKVINSTINSNSWKMVVSELLDNSRVICRDIDLRNIKDSVIAWEFIRVSWKTLWKNKFMGTNIQINDARSWFNTFKLKKWKRINTTTRDSKKSELLDLKKESSILEEKFRDIINARSLEESTSIRDIIEKLQWKYTLDKDYFQKKFLEDNNKKQLWLFDKLEALKSKGYLEQVSENFIITIYWQNAWYEIREFISKLLSNYWKLVSSLKSRNLWYIYMAFKKVETHLIKSWKSLLKLESLIKNWSIWIRYGWNNNYLYIVEWIMQRWIEMAYDIDDFTHRDLFTIAWEDIWDKENMAYYTKVEFNKKGTKLLYERTPTKK